MRPGDSISIVHAAPDRAGVSGDPRPGIWDWSVALEAPLLLGLYDAWQSKCRDGALPGRQDFDPIDMIRFLGSIFLLEAVPEGDDFRYTLIGTEITQHVGRDNTGRFVGEVFGGTGLDLYRQVRDLARPVRVHGVVDWLGKEHKAYETLIMPLADDGRTVNRFIGGMVFSSATESQ
ncbi:MAG: PAS domain-containing protein [Thalassobaculaceae bacterium]|nr:PAS domain-containing protein [Thalassobaculaceae bacterium]